MTDIAIPLSDLRKLWRQAMWAWGSNSDGSATDLWRHYVQQEVARRTIAELRQRITELESQLVEAKKPMRVIVQPDFMIDWGDDTSSAANAEESE